MVSLFSRKLEHRKARRLPPTKIAMDSIEHNIPATALKYTSFSTKCIHGVYIEI
jgi:hypothetical protein